MISTVRSIGVFSLAVLAASGRACILLIQMLGNIPASVRRYELLVEQLYHVGVLTLPIIIVSALFVGMVLALQGYNTLVDFDAESSLGLLVALSLTRELGPVLAGLLFAGRAGAALTAEIGLMKATEQGNDGCRPRTQSFVAAISGRCDIGTFTGRAIYCSRYSEWIFTGCQCVGYRPGGILVCHAGGC